MVDFVFGVSHPQHWHSLNLQANPHHYSLLGKFGSKAVAMTQERFGAGIYFNPFVEVNGMVCVDLLFFQETFDRRDLELTS